MPIEHPQRNTNPGSFEMKTEVESLRRNYYILILAMISMQVTVSTIYMVLPIFFKNHGISVSSNGVLISAGTFAGIFSSLIAGRLSDTRGRKPVLLFGVTVYALVFFLFAILSKDFNTFFILRFIEGFSFYMTPVAITAIAADSFPARDRGKAMALYSMAGGVGQFFGPIVAGLFIGVADFTSYFIFCGVFVATSAGVILLFVRETLPPESKGVKGDYPKGGFDIKRLWSMLKGLGVFVGTYLTAILFQRLGYTMVNPFLSLYLEEELGLNMTSMSFFFAVRALCTLVFSPLAGILADRYGRKPVFLLGSFSLAATMIGYRQATSYELVLATRVTESTSNAILMPTMRAYIADLISPEVRGFGMGLYTTIIEESSTFGALLGGVVAESYGFGGIFLSAAVTSAISAIIVLLKVPEPKKILAAAGSTGS
ncbi:MAG: MFS transporter [Candidatus Bathyarchaeia archaeon]